MVHGLLTAETVNHELADSAYRMQAEDVCICFF